MFGPCVTLCTATHPTKASERLNEAGEELSFPITIGDNVWIGGGAFINPGVTIGKGAVVADTGSLWRSQRIAGRRTDQYRLHFSGERAALSVGEGRVGAWQACDL